MASLYRPLEKYYSVEAKFEKLVKSRKRNQTTFKGQPTKYSLKVDALDNKINKLDLQSDRFMYLWLGKKLKIQL